MSEKEPDLIEVNELDIEHKVRDFGSLLKDIENLDDNLKHLCKEIYENAIVDRQNSYVMFMKLARLVNNNGTEFAVHGKSIRDFIERMQKANDQLSRLLDLIIKVKQATDAVDSDTMYEQIKSFAPQKKGR